MSLNSFIPTDGVPLTQLLSHDFGRGTVIRDLGTEYIEDILRTQLFWTAEYTISTDPTGGASVSGSTSNFIPYGQNTSIVLSNSNDLNVLPQISGSDISINGVASYDDDFEDEDEPQNEFIDQYDEFMWKYNYGYQTKYSIGDKRSFGCTVSALKTDGTWDVIQQSSEYFFPAINTSYFVFHEAQEKYARTPDGYMKIRITLTKPGSSNKRLYNVSYYVMDCLPQKVDLAYSGLSSNMLSRSISEDDEYLRDVKIGIKNLEGVDRIVVEQQDEFDDVPFRYEVPDFKQGYFTATVDKEFYSSFAVIAYNKNGTTRSETFTLEPLEPWTGDESFTISQDGISINRRDFRKRENASMQYEIYRLSSKGTNSMEKGAISNNNKMIDTTHLPSGVYILQCDDGSSIKFKVE